MTHILKQYKLPTGEVHYPAILSVPLAERLPAIVEQDFMKATALVVGALTMAFERLSIKKKVEGDLVNNIADEIIDTCGEDNISMEDLLLFLQKFVRGEYGDVTDLSVSKFMILFDKYRDERYQALCQYRENQHLEYKSLGDPTRVTKPQTEFEEHLQQYTEKLQAKNDEIKLLKREAKERK